MAAERASAFGRKDGRLVPYKRPAQPHLHRQSLLHRDARLVFSRLPDLDKPDVAVFDLDPSGNTGFPEAVAAALLVKTALDTYGLQAFPKLSGKTGVHVTVPIERTDFEEVRTFLKAICKSIERARPEAFTTERVIAKRGDRGVPGCCAERPGQDAALALQRARHAESQCLRARYLGGT